jgi:hypothetical protein
MVATIQLGINRLDLCDFSRRRKQAFLAALLCSRNERSDTEALRTVTSRLPLPSWGRLLLLRVSVCSLGRSSIRLMPVIARGIATDDRAPTITRLIALGRVLTRARHLPV